MPKVSVIVPVYKVEKYIERCARSLMEQTLDDMEFIFVDDCSPDNSIAILESTIAEYPNRKEQVKVIRFEKNQGQVQARLSGFKQATGEFITYCDSDDWVNTQMYQKMYVKAIDEKADVVVCDLYMVYKEESVVYHAPVWTDDKNPSLKAYINNVWSILCNLLIKKDIYAFLNEFEINRSLELGLSFCEDYHLSMRLLLFANKVVNVETPYYYYNKTNENSIVTKIDETAFESERKAYLDVIRFYIEHNEYETYAPELSGRVLRSLQGLILGGNFDTFRSIHPDKKKYIFECVWLNKKMKLMMWSVTHKCSWVARIILMLRNLKKQ